MMKKAGSEADFEACFLNAYYVYKTMSPGR